MVYDKYVMTVHAIVTLAVRMIHFNMNCRLSAVGGTQRFDGHNVSV